MAVLFIDMLPIRRKFQVNALHTRLLFLNGLILWLSKLLNRIIRNFLDSGSAEVAFLLFLFKVHLFL